MDMKVTETENGLLVSNVQIMGVMHDDVRPDVPHGVTIDMMERMVSIFEQNKKRGKMPRFTMGHNKRDKEAPVIGKVVGLRVEHGWLMGDILITNPDAQSQFRRGEIPGLSAEFFPDKNNPALWSVATTMGEEGEFDIEKADFQPTELTEALAAMHSVRAEPVKLAVQEMGMDGMQIEVVGLPELFNRVAVLEEAVMNLQAKPKDEEMKPEGEDGSGEDEGKGPPKQTAKDDKDENESQDESQNKPDASSDKQDGAKSKSDPEGEGEEEKEEEKEDEDAKMSNTSMEVARLRAENDLLKAGVSFKQEVLESVETEEDLAETVATLKASHSAKDDDMPTGERGKLSAPALIKMHIRKIKEEENVNHMQATKLVRERNPELFEKKE
jgi:hypothetical protein